mmetsp:Transcript_107067/g.345457  ORF Transcript_107067/g.345457 Transcript_107067/m.345457 type:complete len:288 (+) Transcript_107067:735-1598(+)
MVHGAKQRHDHAQWVHGGLLAPEVRVPEVRNGPVGGLKLLDERAIFVLAHEVGGDEARAPVHLRDLVRKHVAVVVVARHAEAAARPPDDLHRRGVADEVHQLAPAFVQEARGEVLFLVVRVEDLLHLLPEALLPLEDSLLGDHVRHDMRLEAPREKDVRQVFDIVERIVVDHDTGLLVLDLTAIDDLRLLGLHVLGKIGREYAALAHLLPTCAVLAAHCMAFEQHWPVEAQLDAGDVDGVPGDGDAVPAAAHGAVGRAEGLLEAEFFHLLGRGRDGRFLEDGTDALA